MGSSTLQFIEDMKRIPELRDHALGLEYIMKENPHVLKQIDGIFDSHHYNSKKINFFKMKRTDALFGLKASEVQILMFLCHISSNGYVSVSKRKASEILDISDKTWVNGISTLMKKGFIYKVIGINGHNVPVYKINAGLVSYTKDGFYKEGHNPNAMKDKLDTFNSIKVKDKYYRIEYIAGDKTHIPYNIIAEHEDLEGMGKEISDEIAEKVKRAKYRKAKVDDFGDELPFPEE